MTSINLMPRLEMAGLGLSAPVTYSQFKALNVGFGMQLGPMWLGSGNAFNALIGDIREINVFMGWKISIYHKNKNKSRNRDNVITDSIE